MWRFPANIAVQLYVWTSLLGFDKWSNVHLGGGIDHLYNVVEAAHLRKPKPLLQQAKAPVRGELSVPDHQKRQSDAAMKTDHYPPVEHCIVLILPHAVVGM